MPNSSNKMRGKQQTTVMMTLYNNRINIIKEFNTNNTLKLKISYGFYE